MPATGEESNWTQDWRGMVGRFGIWLPARQATPDLAAAAEGLGFGTVWLGGSPGADLAVVDGLLDATTTLVVATGVVNIWQSDARELAGSFARIDARHPGRFLLGIGAGHPEATSEYARPYEAVAGYLEVLLGAGVPGGSVVLAALGPRMLRLAAQRSAGAHPYLVTTAYTRLAREIMGTGPLLATEHKAVIGTDPLAARELARSRVAPYLGLVNYVSNLRRLGWTDADLAGGGSDALVDALVAHGDPVHIAEQLTEHLLAGADHVCVQVLGPPGADPLGGYQALASALRH